jgi:alginate O-acetyltransferase complex protein AlgI
MLFNSYIFIFYFLPVTLFLFFVLGSLNNKTAAISWLVVASLFFYGWWNPTYLIFIIISILFNYRLGTELMARRSTSIGRWLLYGGVAINLGLISYYKYAEFFIANLNYAFSSNWSIGPIILPLAISFFTFQQITFLVDSWRGEAKHYGLLEYTLFVSFFPQLISGPIVHQGEMLPQFANRSVYRFDSGHVAVGLTIFIIGLFKKVGLADSIAIYATPIFTAADGGESIHFFQAWGAALAYTLQLYFDFSGYSDMAIGLARLFGILLPLNFNSPLKAHNIIEFWHCWHITLTRFLRDYLYISLGGNRKGQVRRYANLIITMGLGGLWHGAAWTFVIWGLLHGLYLIINHAWRILHEKLGNDQNSPGPFGYWSGRLITFIAVVVAFVVFRAETLDGAYNLISGMFGYNGFILPNGFRTILPFMENRTDVVFITYNQLSNPNAIFDQIYWTAGLCFVVWFAPNTQQLTAPYTPVIISKHAVVKPYAIPGIFWRPNLVWGSTICIIFCFTLFRMMTFGHMEFLYRFF